jgi:hypothetical protein
MNHGLWKLPRLTALWKGCRFAWKSAQALFHSPPTGPWKSLRRQVASTIPTAAWKTRTFAVGTLRDDRAIEPPASISPPGSSPRFPQLPQALLLRLERQFQTDSYHQPTRRVLPMFPVQSVTLLPGHSHVGSGPSSVSGYA